MSCEIENLNSGAGQIAIAELGERASKNARLFVGNVRAVQAVLVVSDALTPGAVLDMHRAFLEHSDRQIVGRWRDEPVWMAEKASAPVLRTSSHPTTNACPR